MTRVYLSIGSNIEPAANVRSALTALRRRFGPLTVSTVYRCPAEGFDGPDFYNLAVGLDTALDAGAVNDCLHAIEVEHGRDRGGRKFAARRLDLDLLLYGDEVRDEPGLHLPRDDITRYGFVLGPLAEIAPGLIHPTLKRSIGELWRAFEGEVNLQAVDLSADLTGRHQVDPSA